MRSDYYIKPCVNFHIYKELYTLLPTIFYQPWKYRYIGLPVLTLQWLCFALNIGLWTHKERSEK